MQTAMGIVDGFKEWMGYRAPEAPLAPLEPVARSEEHTRELIALLNEYEADDLFAPIHPKIKALVTAGADPNARDAAGYPLLIQIIRKGDVTVPLLSFLLDSKVEDVPCNPSCRDAYGKPALFYLIDSDEGPLVSTLLKAGAELEISHRGLTALQYAESKDKGNARREIARFILQASNKRARADSFPAPVLSSGGPAAHAAAGAAAASNRGPDLDGRVCPAKRQRTAT
jgi:hypothetical protein